MNDDGNIVTLHDEQREAKLQLTGLALQLYDEGVKLAKARIFETAAIALERVTRMAPKSGHAHCSLSSALWNLGRYDEAWEAAQRGLALLEADDAGPLADVGTLLSSMGDKVSAIAYLKRAVAADPNNVHAKWALAMCLLDHGEWIEGFKVYECRTEYRGAKFYPKMPYPMWEGEDLNGKTIYVQSEQGVGDRILMIRYLYWLKQKWPDCRIKFLASSPDQIHLESLFYSYRDELGVEFLHPQIPWPKDVDFGCYLASLPRIHGTTPDNVPPEPGWIWERVQRERQMVNLPEPLEPAIKVGICWTGNRAMTRNADRSIPPELLFELEADPLVQLYSLQFRDDGLARHSAKVLVCDVASDIEDHGMLGTAAVMLNLDLVITCCTANAHLAGTLGIPTWVLLCDDPYWVWLREREDSVWYPSVRLFRQQSAGDWRGVIDRVKPELHAFAERVLSERQFGEKGMSHGKRSG